MNNKNFSVVEIYCDISSLMPSALKSIYRFVLGSFFRFFTIVLITTSCTKWEHIDSYFAVHSIDGQLIIRFCFPLKRTKLVCFPFQVIAMIVFVRWRQLIPVMVDVRPVWSAAAVVAIVDDFPSSIVITPTTGITPSGSVGRSVRRSVGWLFFSRFSFIFVFLSPLILIQHYLERCNLAFSVVITIVDWFMEVPSPFSFLSLILFAFSFFHYYYSFYY